MFLLLATAIVSTFLAHSEYEARLSAEEARRREIQLRHNEREARVATVSALADSCASKGMMAASRDAPHEAILWFAKAAALAQGRSQPTAGESNTLRKLASKSD